MRDMIGVDKYGDEILEVSPGSLVFAPFTPHLDRLPAHVARPISSGDDADLECVPECPACEVLFSLEHFWDEVGGYAE